jgi:hypothetical protein
LRGDELDVAQALRGLRADLGIIVRQQLAQHAGGLRGALSV